MCGGGVIRHDTGSLMHKDVHAGHRASLSNFRLFSILVPASCRDGGSVLLLILTTLHLGFNWCFLFLKVFIYVFQVSFNCLV